MTAKVVMPQMGESLSEGTIVKWYKKPGEAIERDEPLFEISTDKVDTEVPAPASGVLQRILVSEGQTVAVGTVVAEIGDRAAAGAAAAPSSSPAEPAPGAAAPGGGHFRSSHEQTLFRRRPSQPPPDPPPPPPRSGSDSGARRTHLSPAVLSLAEENGIPMEDLLAIPGTGREGRISRRDVERYLERKDTAPAPSAVARPAAGPPAHYLYQPEPDDKLVPMSSMRKQIAEHMLWSQQISAQVTSFSECDMHRIVRFRDEHRARFEQEEGVPLTFLPFAAVATVRALKDYPIFNSSVAGDRIAFKKHVHLGIAVALEEGLIVPVIRNADEMNFVGLARSIHRLADKARKGGLEPGDVRGATFTITNPGMFGGFTGTPMIAQPQVGILGLGAVTKRPVVVDDAIAIRPIMVLALTFDHRIIDGATGFQFLEAIRKNLESFDLPL